MVLIDTFVNIDEVASETLRRIIVIYLKKSENTSSS